MIKGVTGSLDSVSDSAIKVGASLTAATAPITAFFATAIKQASEQEDALSQLNAVLKSTGGISGVTADMADKLSSSLSKVTRFSDDAVLGAENILLTFTSIGKDIFPDVTKTALDMSQALGQDLKSSSIQLGKALNDPITGLTALRRVGVQFTDQQEEQIKAMVTSGNLMQAQKAILAELTREFGGSAEAAGNTFAGKMDILNHKFGEFQEKIGFIVIPILEKVTDFFGGVIDKVTEWGDKNPQLLTSIVAIAAALVAAGPILIGAGTAIKVIGIAIAALTSPITLVVAAVGLLVAAFATNFGGIRDKLKPILKTLGDGFATIGRDVGLFIARLKEGGLKEALAGLFSIFEDGSSTIKNLLQSFGMAEGPADGIANAISKVYDAFKKLSDFLGTFWALVRPGLEKLANWLIADVLPSIVNFIGSAVIPIIGDLVNTLSGIWDKVSPYLLKLAAWFTSDAVPAIMTFFNGLGVNLNTLLFNIQYTFGSVKDSITKTFTDAAQFIQDKFFTPLQQIGVLIGVWLQPVVDWFEVNIPLAIATVQTVLRDVETFLKNLWKVVQPYVEPIITWFQQAAKTISDFFTPVLTVIQSVIDKALGALALVGKLTGADNSSNGGIVGLLTGATGGGGDAGMGSILGQNVQNLISLISGKSGVSNPISPIAYTSGAIAGDLFSGVRSYLGAGPGGLPAVTGTAAGGGGGNAAFRAAGGPVTAGSRYVVGEQGPELFLPSSNGTIVPNGGQSGKEPVAVTANFPNVTNKTSADEFYQIIDQYFIDLRNARGH